MSIVEIGRNPLDQTNFQARVIVQCTNLDIAHGEIVEAFISLIGIQPEGVFIVVAFSGHRDENRNTKQSRVAKNLQHCWFFNTWHDYIHTTDGVKSAFLN